MAQKLTGNWPDTLDIGDGWTIEWAAVDPTTGAAVSGVVVTNANVVANDVSPAVSDAQAGPFMLVPGPGA